jgi:hypothetical protein
MALLQSNEPAQNQGFFSRTFGDPHAQAFNAYLREQQAAGRRPGDIAFRSIPESKMKAAYRRKYGRSFPE